MNMELLCSYVNFTYTQQFKIMFKIIPLPEEHKDSSERPQTSAFKYIKGTFIYSKVLGSDLLLGLEDRLTTCIQTISDVVHMASRAVSSYFYKRSFVTTAN